jgi:hypothetical protein
VTEGFAEKAVFEQRLEEEGGNHALRGKIIPGVGNSKCKSPVGFFFF